MSVKWLLLMSIGISCLLAIACQYDQAAQKEVSKNEKAVETSQMLPPDTIRFLKNVPFSEVLTQAQAAQKPIFIDFYAPWCRPCKEMHKTVFTDPKAAAFYNEQFINYQVNVKEEEGKRLRIQFKVREYPTLIYTNHQGEEQLSSIGMIDARMLVEFGQDVLNDL